LGRGRRVLVVEDDEDIREIITEILMRHGLMPFARRIHRHEPVIRFVDAGALQSADTIGSAERLGRPGDAAAILLALRPPHGRDLEGRDRRLVLAMPLGGTCDHEAGWRALGAWAGYRVLERVALEPTPADDISCRWYRNEDTPSGWGARWFAAEIRSPSVSWERARRSPADVRSISASSQITRQADVYTEDGAVTDPSNTAEAAFDGLLETAWSEAAKADVGQYLELELAKPAEGLRVMTGFIGALHAFEGFGADKKQASLYKNLWAYNARPAELELVAVDGSRTWTLPVQDKKAVWNVYPILVPAGRDRLVINATAKGKKWQDTSIAEVDFATGDAAWLEGLRQDPFFAPFFADGAALSAAVGQQAAEPGQLTAGPDA
jgi:CheY-like chemotaxis protein